MNNIKKPKRRRYKDNPYSLLYDGEYEIKLTTNGKTKILKVNQDLYEAFNKFELEDLKEMNEYDRNLTHYELDENSLYNLSLNKKVELCQVFRHIFWKGVFGSYLRECLKINVNF